MARPDITKKRFLCHVGVLSISNEVQGLLSLRPAILLLKNMRQVNSFHVTQLIHPYEIRVLVTKGKNSDCKQ